MQRALLIAEKPSLMQQIKDVYDRHQSELPYTADFISQRGHLVTLKLPKEADKNIHGRSWDNLPYVPEEHGGWQYKVVEDRLSAEQKKKHYQTSAQRLDAIRKALDTGKYDFIIHAGDPDQEGELLVNLVLDFIHNSLPVCRFWTNDLTEPHILNALKHLKDDRTDPMLTNLLAAAYGRQHSDYRIGMNISEAASLKMNANVACGRVMTPILAIVCKREDEIENFRPKTVYGVQAEYAENFTGTLFDASGSDEKSDDEDKKQGTVWFDTKKEAEDLIKSLGKQAVVKSYTPKRTKTRAPKLYTLSSIQTDAGHAYGYSAKKVLDICQSLYEKKLQSYPRTDCEYLASGEDFAGILAAASCVPELKPYIDTVGKDQIEKTRKDSRWINDKAMSESGHSALRPTTKKPVMDQLTQEEKNIYTMVAKRFVAIFLPPLVQDKAELVADVDGHTFRSTGKTLIDPGFSKIFGTKFTDNEIPRHQEGDVLDVNRFKNVQKTSTCPKRYTQADLIAACEKPAKFLSDESLKSLGKDLKIGTPATRAGIIQKLIDKDKYMAEEKKGKLAYIKPTTNGRAIIKNLSGMMITRVDMTGLWEEELQKVRAGEETLETFDNNMRRNTAAMVDEIKNATMTAEVEGRKMRETYPVMWKGEEKSFSRVFNGHRFTDEECKNLADLKDITFEEKNRFGDLCRYTGSLALQEFTAKNKKTYQYIGFLPKETVNLNPEKERRECVFDGQEMSYRRVWGHHRFTDAECALLEKPDHPDIVIDAVNKDKDPCRVRGHLALLEKPDKKGTYLGFQMTDFENLNPEKAKIPCIWQGQERSFSPKWGSHTFTEEEKEALKRGESITFIMPGKVQGEKYAVTGALDEYQLKGKTVFGFKYQKYENTDPAKRQIHGVWKDREVHFKASWGGHMFSEEEKQKLLAGEEIEFHLTNKGGDDCIVKGRLADLKTENGHPYVGFDRTSFTNTNPAKQRNEDDYYSGMFGKKKIRFKRYIGKIRLTDEQCEDLLAKKTIEVYDIPKKSGFGTYSASFKLARQTIKGTNIKFYGTKRVKYL